jgi:hypothetical protein
MQREIFQHETLRQQRGGNGEQVRAYERQAAQQAQQRLLRRIAYASANTLTTLAERLRTYGSTGADYADPQYS